MKRSGCRAVILTLALLGSTAVQGQSVSPFPPRLQPLMIDIPLNGGRVHSISVNPTDSRRIVVSAEVGGLWMTDDGGDRWWHVDGLPAFFANDVAWSPDGTTVIATLVKDNRVDNGGGIWVSRDGGGSWSRPASAVPPADGRIPARISGRGIAYAPDDAARVYAGTDYGLAISTDNGATWSHRMLDPTSPVLDDRLQDAVFSVAGLPGNRVVALTRTGVWLGTYRPRSGSMSWRNVRPGDFTFGNGFKNVDVSPVDPDKVFVLQDYSTLLLFEVAAGRWTPIPLPGGSSRGPFVRVGRAAGAGSAMDIWVGTGVVLRRATCPDIACVRGLTAASWTTLGRDKGLHDDAGHLGLDSRSQPVLYGSDGGLFKPADASATLWTYAEADGRRNSYQITDLAGTNVPIAETGRYRQSLYFSTQDNGVWASADNGATWPAVECCEGFHMETRKDALADADVTVGYGTAGYYAEKRMSGASFAGARDVSNLDMGGTALPGFGEIFYLSPNRWVRQRFQPGVNPEVYVSENNAMNWRKHGDFPFQLQGVFSVSGSVRFPTVFLPVLGGRRTAAGADRIALLRMRNLFDAALRSYGEADLLYLPDDGSLGLRATMFDWQAVFGVNPTDPYFIIAPDIVNQVVKVSRNGGFSWTTDAELTRLVTRDGTLLLHEDAYRMQVTHIAFDPYFPDRILVGTRDAGVILSENRGLTWRSIAETDRIAYITGFFFRRNGPVVVSSYGNGLWEIDLRLRLLPFPEIFYCRTPCNIRFPPDPRRRFEVDWRTRTVLFVVGGRINGVVMSGSEIESVTVSPGSRVLQYTPGGVESQVRLPIREAKKGAGFKGLKRALGCPFRREVLTGLVFEEGRFTGLISTRGEVKEEAPVRSQVPVQVPAAPEAPYLLLSTDLAMSGLPVLAGNGVLYVLGRGFRAAPELSLEIDGKPVEGEMQLDQEGTLRMKLVVPEGLHYGEHTLEIIETTPEGERVARGRFVKAVIDDFKRQPPE